MAEGAKSMRWATFAVAGFALAIQGHCTAGKRCAPPVLCVVMPASWWVSSLPYRVQGTAPAKNSASITHGDPAPCHHSGTFSIAEGLTSRTT
jgi:hypothetical protein